MTNTYIQTNYKINGLDVELLFSEGGRLHKSSSAMLKRLDHRFCGKCKKVLPLSAFNIVKGAPRAYCQDCTKATGRQSAKSRYYRDDTGKRSERSRLARLMIEACGRCCYVCAYNEYLSALEYHHFQKPSFRIPEKFFAILGSSGERQLEHATELSKELRKCEIVCCNCHNALHAGDVVLTSLLESFRGIKISPQKIVELAAQAKRL